MGLCLTFRTSFLPNVIEEWAEGSLSATVRAWLSLEYEPVSRLLLGMSVFFARCGFDLFRSVRVEGSAAFLSAVDDGPKFLLVQSI